MHHLFRICIVIVAFLIVILMGMNSPLLTGRAAGPWYVTPLGNDGNACDTPGAPCKTITGALSKPAFAPGDTVKVATGVYTSTTGSEVVLLDHSANLSGGWNGAFTGQSGMSTLEGGYFQRSITLETGQTVSMERFIIQNGSGPCPGIINMGTLSLHNTVIKNNSGEGGGICNAGILSVADSQIFDNHGWDGGGISNSGSLTVNNTQLYENTGNVGGAIRSNSPGSVTINHSIIRDNSAMGGGGISVADSTLILNESTIIGNEPTGLAVEGGQATVNNCTISENKANTGGGVYVGNSSSIVNINNSTIVYNFATTGGGIYIAEGTVTVRNSIVAENQSYSSPECHGAISSSGYNLFGITAGCTIIPGAGDMTNIGPMLGPLVGSPGYYHLLLGSPAIDAGNPAAPGSGGDACLLTDQRGVTRLGRCDIGAYEYTTPGPAANITVLSGALQRAAPDSAFWDPIRLAVLDASGGPAANVPVTFVAPSSGPSAFFADSGTHTTTVYTDLSGFVSSPEFYASGVSGTFAITASSGNPAATASIDLMVGIPWYVSKAGNDANNCLTPATACATIPAPLIKPAFVPGDTIRVATGIYTSTSPTEVVLLDHSATLSGGWNNAFTEQDGMATMDGEGSRRVVTVDSGQMVRMERLIVQNGSGNDCPGISNQGTLSLKRSVIRNNIGSRGGGMCNDGTLTVSDSQIAGNQSNDGAGIYNNGTLTVTDGVIEANRAGSVGGGIYTNSSGLVSVSHTILRDNRSGGGAGGIYSLDTNLSLNDSQIIRNESRGLSLFRSRVTINNSTISYNLGRAYQGLGDGGGIFVFDGNYVTINNSTISHNIAGSGAGIYLTQGESLVNINDSTLAFNYAESGAGLNNLTGSIALRNTIVAENIAKSGPDCLGIVNSSGYNLIGNTAGCTFTPGTGDLTNISPQLGPLVGSPGYHYLPPGSPAINAGNPAAPGSGGNACLLTDQRGVVRAGRCDIGAYEYTAPGAATRITITGGAEQHTVPYAEFVDPLRVAVLDAVGNPVANARVTFTAPSSGPSAVFSGSGTYTTTVLTDPSGFAASPIFSANAIPGTFSMTASTGDPIAADTVDLFIDTPWYAATQGNNANGCQTPATPCATVAGVLGKTGFMEGDAILLGEGTYTSAGSEVILFNKGARVWGGWNPDFTSRSGVSILDGQNARRGIQVNNGVTVSLHNFVIQDAYTTQNGAGFYNEGNLTLYKSEVKDNIADMGGGGGKSPGTLTLIDTVIRNNIGRGGHSGISGENGDITLIRSAVVNNGGGLISGIYIYLGILTLDNSIVAGNTQERWDFEIRNYGTARISNSIITDFLGNSLGGSAILQNSIIANNVPDSECHVPEFTSFGYNLIGNAAQCSYTLATGDQIGISPRLVGSGNGYALLPGSPAIDAGNPTGCIDSSGNLALVDQRGFTRHYDGNGDGIARCDIGSYEFDPLNPVRLTYLPALTTPWPGISGRVTLNGAPIADVTLDLRFYNGSVWSTLASTTTSAEGIYSFTGVPTLSAGQKYYVRYLNPDDGSRLYLWSTRELTQYTAGSVVTIGNFDIANIELNLPEAGAWVHLPYTFQWTPRPASPLDSYEYDLYDYQDGDPYFYTPLLGYVGSYRLAGVPAGFSIGIDYVWDIWVYSQDGGAGVSYWSYYVRFTRNQASQAESAQVIRLPHAGDVRSPEAPALTQPADKHR